MPRSPLAWRSGGAESVCERIWRFIARIGFDSPHLHTSLPGLPLEARGFCTRMRTGVNSRVGRSMMRGIVRESCRY